MDLAAKTFDGNPKAHSKRPAAAAPTPAGKASRTTRSGGTPGTGAHLQTPHQLPVRAPFRAAQLPRLKAAHARRWPDPD